jgi:hypothetical protein
MDLDRLTAEVHAVIRRARTWGAADVDQIALTARNMHDEARVLRRLVELTGESDTQWKRPSLLIAKWLDEAEERWTVALANVDETALALCVADLRDLARKWTALRDMMNGNAPAPRPKLELVRGYRDTTQDQIPGVWRGPNE